LGGGHRLVVMVLVSVVFPTNTGAQSEIKACRQT
jgi:hypothetical protein